MKKLNEAIDTTEIKQIGEALDQLDQVFGIYAERLPTVRTALETAKNTFSTYLNGEDIWKKIVNALTKALGVKDGKAAKPLKILSDIVAFMATMHKGFSVLPQIIERFGAKALNNPSTPLNQVFLESDDKNSALKSLQPKFVNAFTPEQTIAQKIPYGIQPAALAKDIFNLSYTEIVELAGKSESSIKIPATESEIKQLVQTKQEATAATQQSKQSVQTAKQTSSPNTVQQTQQTTKPQKPKIPSDGIRSRLRNANVNNEQEDLIVGIVRDALKNYILLENFDTNRAAISELHKLGMFDTVQKVAKKTGLSVNETISILIQSIIKNN